MTATTETTIKHYHIEGVFADDEPQPAMDLLGAIYNAQERLQILSEGLYQDADAFADSEDYREAWFALKKSDEMETAQKNIGRFSRYILDASTRPPVYQTDAEVESGARYVLGIESVNGQWSELGEVEVSVCFDLVEEDDNGELWHVEEDGGE